MENSFNSVCSSARRLARTRSSSTMTITLSKNASTGSCAVGKRQQRFLVFLLLPVRFDLWRGTLNVGGQRLFSSLGRIGQWLRTLRLTATSAFLRLLQDVPHALEGGRNGLGTRRCSVPCFTASARATASTTSSESSRQHRIHHVVLESRGLAQIELQRSRKSLGLRGVVELRRKTSARLRILDRLRAHP